MNRAQEANFDGLIGATHNYGGLSDGNLASESHAGLVSYPKQAALQGLAKMRHMFTRVLWQGVLPPQQRPFLPFLHALGFRGTDESLYEKVWQSDPYLAKNIMSASSMWAANAASVSPSVDSMDGRVHFTPANLGCMLHRSIEPEQTGRGLEKAFPFAIVHPPLPAQNLLMDEGAANHVRLCKQHGAPGVSLFVYGRDGTKAVPSLRFPARQTLQAGQAVARCHGLNMQQVVMAEQSRLAIEAGAFHNDVVCVGALDTLFYHAQAFADKEKMRRDICVAANDLFTPQFIEVSAEDVSLPEAIDSYLFNSMLVRFPNQDRLSLIAPLEVYEHERVRAFCDTLIAGNGPISEVMYVDVRQSMCNGGGPACLRLRVVLTESEWENGVNPAMKINESNLEVLEKWVQKHYRDQLLPQDLPDPALMRENFSALDELTTILGLGKDFYPFQRC